MCVSKINEIERQIPIQYNADVIVAGGGVAGIAAALAAARSGAQVLLIEKQCLVGGLATSGLVTGYLPICDGHGHQVSYGLAEELLWLSVKYGEESPVPDAWKEHRPPEEKTKRFGANFNASFFALLTEQLLREEKVQILYDTTICAALTENQKITALILENKSGRIAAQAKSYVDATGDATLFHLSQLPCRLFGKGNILAGWYYYFNGDEVKLRPLGFAEVFDEDKKDTVKPLITRRFAGVDGDEISDYLLLSHEATLEDILKQRGKNEAVIPTAITTMPQLRMTRCIEGEYTLKESENEVSFPDSIGMITDWRKRGMIYEVPYRTLYNKQLRNVICAGRCISVDDGMWDISRVIPPCIVTGEAAGTAAAMTSDFVMLSYEELAKELRKHGQKLNFSEME